MCRNKYGNTKPGSFYFFQSATGNISYGQNNGGDVNIIRGADIYQFTVSGKQSGHCTLAAIFKLFIFLSLFKAIFVPRFLTRKEIDNDPEKKQSVAADKKISKLLF